MTRSHRTALVGIVIGLLAVPTLWAGGLLDRDAQRLARARENHAAEIGRAFEVYGRRIESANTALSRIYDQTIKQYESRGDNATAEALRRELDDLIGQSMTMAFPSDDIEVEVKDDSEVEVEFEVDAANDEGPTVRSFERLIEAIGPTVVHASGSRAPSTNAVNYDHVVLYYTASWCGPCRRFTPELIRFYQANHTRGSKWNILVVSGDFTLEAFENYVLTANMPWYVVPYDRKDAMHALYSGGYPRVHVVNREGRVVLRSRLARQTYEEFFAELRQTLSP